jgi:TfoX/Sxy family transcriptional regulator of competence genes
MAWVKVPKENHSIFRTALPAQPRSTTIPMFGGLCATVNGNIACGLFGKSVMVRLGDARAAALALDGASAFDPMGRGARHGEDKVVLPESVLADRDELRSLLQRALDHTATLPRKATKSSSTSAKRATKAAAKSGSRRAVKKRR